MTLLQNILDLLRTEDAPVNNAGGGAVAGLGVGPEGEPGVNLKKKRKTDGDDPLVETAEFVGKANPKNAIYAKLMTKGKPIGPDLYELTGKHVTPEIRRSLSAGFARGPEETDSFYLKHKADVTGIPSDDGYILKDKRPAYIKRFGIKEDTKLWKYNRRSGYWDLQRSTVNPHDEEKWLGIFQKYEPSEHFKLSKNRPSSKPKLQEDTPTQYFVGSYVSNDRKIKGTIHRVGSLTSGHHILTLKDAHSGKVIRDLKYSGGAAAKKAWLSIQKDGLDALQEAADDTFAGGDVMDVDLGRVMTALNPKKPWERFSKYVGIDEVGENIRVHARENWKKNIILRDAKTGIMTYLRRRK